MSEAARRWGVSDYHPLEVAGGVVRGRADIEPLTAEPARTSRVALELAVLRALQQPPCVVSFSGGRDSSTILAVAVRVAHRERLPPPVPVTLRFPRDPASDEREWQEMVVRHIGLEDWQRIDLDDDEIDIVGPHAEAVLRRHGLLYPVNAHFHLPIATFARGGAVLTGLGGDEVLSGARYRRLNAMLHGGRSPRPRPRPGDLLSAAGAYGPAWLRALAVERRVPYSLSWLTPAAARELQRWRARLVSSQQVRWDRWVTESWWTDRGRVVGASSLALIAGDVGACAVHPFEDPVFLSTVAREKGAVGYWNRREALDTLAGDVLPPGFSQRVTKASFNHSFFGKYSRVAVAAWDGTGVDTDVVDPVALRAAWSETRVDARSQWLLQALRLAQLEGVDVLEQQLD